MKFKHLYNLVLTMVLGFIILLASDFLGENNPLRIMSNEINQFVYNRGVE